MEHLREIFLRKMFQKSAKVATKPGKSPANVPKNSQKARADCDALATKLALEVPRTSNLSEFPLRIAFARYALSAKAGRRANPGEKHQQLVKLSENHDMLILCMSLYSKRRLE